MLAMSGGFSHKVFGFFTKQLWPQHWQCKFLYRILLMHFSPDLKEPLCWQDSLIFMSIQSLACALRLPTGVQINTNYSDVLCTGLRAPTHFTKAITLLSNVNDFWLLLSCFRFIWVAQSWKDLCFINKNLTCTTLLSFPFTNSSVNVYT